MVTEAGDSSAVSALFRTRESAELGFQNLLDLGFARNTINLLRDKASAAKFEQRSHRICPSIANSAVSLNCFSPSLG